MTQTQAPRTRTDVAVETCLPLLAAAQLLFVPAGGANDSFTSPEGILLRPELRP